MVTSFKQERLGPYFLTWLVPMYTILALLWCIAILFMPPRPPTYFVVWVIIILVLAYLATSIARKVMTIELRDGSLVTADLRYGPVHRLWTLLEIPYARITAVKQAKWWMGKVFGLHAVFIESTEERRFLPSSEPYEKAIRLGPYYFTPQQALRVVQAIERRRTS